MTTYAVRYVEVRGIEQNPMPEYATELPLSELPQQHDNVWLGSQRYQVSLREFDHSITLAILYVVPIGKPRAECQNVTPQGERIGT